MLYDLILKNGIMPTWFMMVLIPILIWDIIWRGMALWKAGRNNQLGWFIGLLLVNSVGILPIIYLLFFQEKEEQKKGTNKGKK